MAKERPNRGKLIALAALAWAIVVLSAYYGANFEYYRSQFRAFSGFLGI